MNKVSYTAPLGKAVIVTGQRLLRSLLVVLIIATTISISAPPAGASIDPLSCDNAVTSQEYGSTNEVGETNVAELRYAEDCAAWVRVSNGFAELGNNAFIVAYDCADASAACRGEFKHVPLRSGVNWSFAVPSNADAYRLCWSTNLAAPFNFCGEPYVPSDEAVPPVTTSSASGTIPVYEQAAAVAQELCTSSTPPTGTTTTVRSVVSDTPTPSESSVSPTTTTTNRSGPPTGTATTHTTNASSTSDPPPAGTFEFEFPCATPLSWGDLGGIANGTIKLLVFDYTACGDLLSAGCVFEVAVALPTPGKILKLGKVVKSVDKATDARRAANTVSSVRFANGKFAPGQLEIHFAKHADDWGTIGIDAYLARARSVLSTDVGDGVRGFTRSNGDVVRYVESTNEFAVAAADGTIRTLFKPEDGLSYYLNQVPG